MKCEAEMNYLAAAVRDFANTLPPSVGQAFIEKANSAWTNIRNELDAPPPESSCPVENLE